MVNPFGKHLWKFARKGSFFQKRQLLRERRQQLPNSGRDFSEMNTNLGKSRLVGVPMECWLSICTVGINSVIPLAFRAHTRSVLSNAMSRMIYILWKFNSRTVVNSKKSNSSTGLETNAYWVTINKSCRLGLWNPRQNSYNDCICRICLL